MHNKGSRAAISQRRDDTGISLQPPVWNLGVGVAAATVSGLYFVYRYVLAEPPHGLGFLPYGVVLAIAAGVLLITARDSIEANDEYLTRRRGGRIIRRAPTREVVEVRACLLGKELCFRDGARILVPYYWTNADRVAAFFQRRTTAHRNQSLHRTVDDLIIHAPTALRKPSRDARSANLRLPRNERRPV